MKLPLQGRIHIFQYGSEDSDSDPDQNKMYLKPCSPSNFNSSRPLFFKFVLNFGEKKRDKAEFSKLGLKTRL